MQRFDSTLFRASVATNPDVTLIEALLDRPSATLSTVAPPLLTNGASSEKPVKVFTQIDAPKMATSYWRAVAGP